MFPVGTVGGRERETEGWRGGEGGGGGGLVRESMAAEATALLTRLCSSALITPLVARSRLSGGASRRGTFNGDRSEV